MTDKDNVVTMIRHLNAGEMLNVDGEEIKANQDIPVYHKIANPKRSKQERPW